MGCNPPPFPQMPRLVGGVIYSLRMIFGKEEPLNVGAGFMPARDGVLIALFGRG